ncbi:hypothetical protein ACFLXE_07485, partial [Chloroflexota bacterium]
MTGKCSRHSECSWFGQKGSGGCEGCGFQHFDRVLKYHDGDPLISRLGKDYFNLCSQGRSRGGRLALDQPLRNLLRDELPEGSKELAVKEIEITIGTDQVVFEPKFDGAFDIGRKCLFYEVKGYGDNTNDILSAISAAQ